MSFVLLSVLTPLLGGTILLLLKDTMKRGTLLRIVGFLLLLTAALTGGALLTERNCPIEVFALTKELTIYFCLDEMGCVFAALSTIILTCAGFFSFSYMRKEHWEKRYYGFYLLVYGVLNGLCCAGNLPTFYLFFELLTLASMMLVFHHGSREAVMAGLKYLFYSMCGAYMALFGFFFVAGYAKDLTFQPGGFLEDSVLQEHSALFLVVVFLMIVGFSVKGGMLPFHAWLPTAHPVAPAPASAVLSAVIVKAGVLAVLRMVYYVFGASFLQGSWVQTVWLVLVLLTVFMGSMLAYREPVLKKRLAYSTVSQVSYILFGLAMVHPEAMMGGLLHVLAHGLIKATLFLCAGAIIHQTGKTRVEELTGIGKEMPLTLWCYTIASLGLIGIPPTGGFVSKWWLATGAINSQVPLFSLLGPIILLVSALLTAGYLLPISIHGFLPGQRYANQVWEKKEADLLMLLPLLILTVLSVLMGLFPMPFVSWMTNAVSALF